jgi:hypothetical protein
MRDDDATPPPRQHQPPRTPWKKLSHCPLHCLESACSLRMHSERYTPSSSLRTWRVGVVVCVFTRISTTRLMWLIALCLPPTCFDQYVIPNSQYLKDRHKMRTLQSPTACPPALLHWDNTRGNATIAIHQIASLDAGTDSEPTMNLWTLHPQAPCHSSRASLFISLGALKPLVRTRQRATSNDEINV